MIATESVLIEEFKNQYNNINKAVFSEEKRQEAWDIFHKTGMPGRKTEEYKFSPITKLLEKNLEISGGSASENFSFKKSDVEKHFIESSDGYKIVLVNGELNQELSVFPDSIKLEKITDLTSEQVIAHVGRYIQPHEDPFVALNAALATCGVAFCIPKNVVIDKPVYVYNITDSTTAQINHQVRNIIILEENSQARIIMINKGAGEKTTFINEVNEVLLQKNAHLEWIRLEEESEKCFHINNTKVYQERSSHFHAVAITISGGLIRNNLSVAIDGEGCESNLYGLYMIGDNSIVDNHTVVDHKKPNSNSNELYKGILFDQSKGVFNGKIFVRPDAQKTNAFQSNQNILVSPEATINAKPQLEIWADDVKCSHGCTTGQMNEDAIFYLQARGINKLKAKALILQAFAGEVLEHIHLPEVKSFMEAYVSKKLGV